MHIRAFVESDCPQVWLIVQDVAQVGETFAFDPAMTAAQAHDLWVEMPPGLTVVAVESDRVLGTAKMGPNHPRPGIARGDCELHGRRIVPLGAGLGYAVVR
jgi:hypothetical protein